MSIRFAAGAALVTVVASMTAACGGKSAPPSPIQNAVTATKGKGTAKFSLVYKEAGKPLTRGSGAVDFATYRGKSVLHFKHALPYRMIWDDTGLYVNTAAIVLYRGGRKLAKPKQHWVKAIPGYEYELVGPLRMLDVSRAIDLVSVGDEQDVGRERGLEHYKGTVPFDRFVKVFLPPNVAKPLLAQEHAAVPVEAWVGRYGLLRRIRYSIPALAGDAAAARATLEIRGFGRRVDLAPPPPEDTIDIRSLQPERKKK